MLSLIINAFMILPDHQKPDNEYVRLEHLEGATHEAS